MEHGDDIAKHINIGVGRETSTAEAPAANAEDEDDEDFKNFRQEQAVREMFAALRRSEAETDDNPDFENNQQTPVTVEVGAIFKSMEEASIAARVKSVAPLRKLPGGSHTFGAWCCASRKRANIYNISEGAAVTFNASTEECTALVHVQVNPRPSSLRRSCTSTVAL